ncbi:MAG: M67 family metallopeptidase [Chloroflexota bacterium]|nr:M67 family metallopeptidase [Chloroflexota bacterium]MDE2918635.1 M67 family metallopeptidase [Chloroflexota bacterium]
MSFQLTRAQHDQIVAQARAEAPLECCGVIGGKGETALKIYPARNADQSRVHYTIDPRDMLNATRDIEDVQGWDISAFYHSHPRSDAYPSPTDVREAVESGYSEYSRFIIVSLMDPDRPVMRCFWLRGGTISEEPLLVIDPADDEGT